MKRACADMMHRPTGSKLPTLALKRQNETVPTWRACTATPGSAHGDSEGGKKKEQQKLVTSAGVDVEAEPDEGPAPDVHQHRLTPSTDVDVQEEPDEGPALYAQQYRQTPSAGVDAEAERNEGPE
ncbi:hypothetical protein ZHAS_00015099 [Anopheles sinensis]|uniref:Uncharacterized protein n=1 Tax=Anopheles sinensis TaxID=74873 RepID=A0A084WAC3_ANOSI|nr:hypothetical protein ZHAS_00015099 [Anopheles sinensis]